MTLVELLVGMVLAALISAAVVKLLTSQQRFYVKASQTLDGRSQVRQALSLLPPELAAVTPSAGELLAVLDTAVDFRSTIGAAVACTIAPSGSGRTLELAPLRTDSVALSGFTAAPQIGDNLAILNDSTGTFVDVGVTAVDSATTYCAAGPFSKAPAGTMRYRLTVAEALNAFRHPNGSAIRVTRRVRYSLYKSATDNKWYLGRKVQQAGSTALGGMQMVAGPYAPPVANTGGGLMFRYYQASGAVTTTPVLVARIDIAVRGDSARISSGNKPTETDSVSVSLRNRF
jgi:Tfp pilus assembly protein PilW